MPAELPQCPHLRKATGRWTGLQLITATSVTALVLTDSLNTYLLGTDSVPGTMVGTKV